MNQVRRTRVVAVLALAAFVGSVDLTVATTMLRRIIVHLEIPLPEGFGRAAWIVNAYLVAYVAGMPFAGRLSDAWGRRRVAVGALVLFGIGSALAPFATSLETFIAARVIAALGAGAIVPVALATVADLYPERRGRVIGTLLAAETLGYVGGPLFGAVLIRYFDWTWHFYAMAPLAVITLALTLVVMRPIPVSTQRRRLDLAGATALTVALVSVVMALLQVGEIVSATDLAGLGDGGGIPPWPLALIGLLAITAFIVIERRTTDPLVPPALLRHRNIAPAMVVNLLLGAILAVALVNVPLFVNLVVEADLKRAAVTSGLVLTALTATMAVSAPLGGWLSDRVSYRLPVVAGTAFLGVGLVLMGTGWGVGVGVGAMALHLTLVGIGFGLATAALSAAVINGAGPLERGVAASLVLMTRLVGLALGLAGLTGWALRRFETLRDRLDLPSLTDPGYAEAVEIAQRQISATVLSETFLVSAAVAATALAVALLLRHSTEAVVET